MTDGPIYHSLSGGQELSSSHELETPKESAKYFSTSILEQKDLEMACLLTLCFFALESVCMSAHFYGQKYNCSFSSSQSEKCSVCILFVHFKAA